MDEEEPMRHNRLVTLCVLLMFAGTGTTQSEPRKKPTPSAVSGKDMYVAYCASCHGIDGRGNGPAANALKVAPTDLTTLAKNNGGSFPALHIAHTIEGEKTIAAHGSREMPIWGQRFWTMSQGDRGQVQLRVKNLTEYIGSLQQK